MAAVLKHWREAATLILVTSSKLAKGTSLQLTLANSQPKRNRHPDDKIDILLLKRSSKSKFMPNLYVFPGGVAVNSDFSSEWLSVFGKLGLDSQEALFEQLRKGSESAAPMFTRQRDPAYSKIPSEVAFRICAIRETFEESGVLLAQPVERSKSILKNGVLNRSALYQDSKITNAWRQRVNEDPNEFLNMCLELDLIPEIWSLYEWSNWLTPAKAAENQRRFDTAFYVCCVDYKPDAVEDAGETVRAIWASPSSLLTAYYERMSGLAVPQVYELARLVRFQSSKDLLKFVRNPDRTRVQRLLPLPVYGKDFHIQVMTGDDLYNKEVDPISKESYLKFDNSLDELNCRYPNHHRLMASQSQGVFFIQCNIPPPKGHIYPDLVALDNIKAKTKAKL